MKTLKTSVLIILLFLNNSNSQGAKLMSEEDLNNIEKFNPQDFGFAGVLPSYYTMEKYVPPVADQGQYSTCVGFSAVYYALSTMYNIEFNYTSFQDRYAHAFDPYFIYSIINNNYDNECDEGLYVSEAVENLKSIGTKKRWLPPYTRCNTDWTNDKILKVRSYTIPYKLTGYKRHDPESIGSIKYALSINKPITALFALTDSFESKPGSNNSYGVGSDGLWDPNTSESVTGYHAMTIIGYDDYNFGGALRLVNSWGKDHGDDGYLWIKYSDFKNFCKRAFSYSADFSQNFDYRTNFRRYKLDSGIYEGEYYSEGFEGYGIWYSNSSDTYYFGYLDKDGNWDGPHVRLTPEEFLYGKYKNGQFIDETDYGFAGVDEDEEMLIDYFNLFKDDLKFGKFNNQGESKDRPVLSKRILIKNNQ